MASAESKTTMIVLRSSDGKQFVVEEAVAMQSQTIRCMIEDGCIDNEVPLHNVHSNILTKVIEYCKKHVESSAADADANDNDLKTWDAEFAKVDEAMLFHFIMAANYLDVKGLLELTFQTTADMIKGKTPEAIRTTFRIKNDFTSEEKEAIRRETQWVFP